MSHYVLSQASCSDDDSTQVVDPIDDDAWERAFQ